VKEAWGHVTGDSGTKFEGKVDQWKGRAQEKLGELEGKEARLESEIERKS
jgi:uncharacterized protein YjbJ (UPF0337 family)